MQGGSFATGHLTLDHLVTRALSLQLWLERCLQLLSAFPSMDFLLVPLNPAHSKWPCTIHTVHTQFTWYAQLQLPEGESMTTPISSSVLVVHRLNPGHLGSRMQSSGTAPVQCSALLLCCCWVTFSVPASFHLVYDLERTPADGWRTMDLRRPPDGTVSSSGHTGRGVNEAASSADRRSHSGPACIHSIDQRMKNLKQPPGETISSKNYIGRASSGVMMSAGCRGIKSLNTVGHYPVPPSPT